MTIIVDWQSRCEARLVERDNVAELAAWCDGTAYEWYIPTHRGWRPEPAGVFEKAMRALEETMILDLKYDMHRQLWGADGKFDDRPIQGPCGPVRASVHVPEAEESAREGEWIVRVEVTPEDVLWTVLEADDMAAVFA
jgi:hypothetical protein